MNNGNTNDTAATGQPGQSGQSSQSKQSKQSAQLSGKAAKRARQKAGRQLRRQAEQELAARIKRKRTIRNWSIFGGVVVVLLLAWYVVIPLFQGDDDDTADVVIGDSDTPTTTTSPDDQTPSDPSEPSNIANIADATTADYTPYADSDYGTTPCPTQKPATPTLNFADSFANCLLPNTQYTATFVTSLGDIIVDLDSQNTPGTANNFVSLAQSGYYDGTLLHRTDPSIGIIQGGSPTTNSAADPGPGYTIKDEGTGFNYHPGMLVMARSAGPDSAGAQFFFAVNEQTAALDGQGTYVVFGDTIAGQDVLEAILASHQDDPTSDLGGAPNPPVELLSLEISSRDATADATDEPDDAVATTTAPDAATTTTAPDAATTTTAPATTAAEPPVETTTTTAPEPSDTTVPSTTVPSTTTVPPTTTIEEIMLPNYTPYTDSDYGTTPCPQEKPASPTLEFADSFANCLQPGAQYTATFATSLGNFTVALDTQNTPGTANNFASLAQSGYYDGTLLHRTDPSIGIIQGGSPTTNSAADPGPGYTILDEGTGFSYRPGMIVMARTGAPNSAGAQFFFAVNEQTALLDGQGVYVVFGETISGLDVLEAILASHQDDPANPLGGSPNPPVVLVSVEISQS